MPLLAQRLQIDIRARRCAQLGKWLIGNRQQSTLKRPSDFPQADTRRMSRCRSEFRRKFQSMTSLVMCVFQSVCA
ncbi:hypothetical protein WT27_28330 [Burkholderia territorii]|uniref:Uncharacterized protein n=1 Tax=Burkholderia territorii TaxID=1503055 RepID=A0A105VSA3_9BURK|nr:hypothetical protein WT27_28330 [Burkholderia territorii]